MAKCDEGYLCEVCGKDVEAINDSDLYLRFILGEVDPETLHLAPERHLRCNPTLAQFIVDADFQPLHIEGPFAKSSLDPAFVREEETRVTAAFRRLGMLLRSKEEIPITDYPLPDQAARWRSPAADPDEHFDRFNRA